VANIVIAIDGVVGSGKSTTARLVAETLGYRHLDTGAMYRAVALAARRQGIESEDERALADLLPTLHIDLLPSDQGASVILNGEDVSEEIRRPETTRCVGRFADRPIVRRALVTRQQTLGARGGVVAEGRDMGLVVFPNAELKVRMVANLDVRTQRRLDELVAKGIATCFDEVRTDIAERDREDAQRDYGGDGVAADYLDVDTTNMNLAQQVATVVDLARQRGAQ
tara:strand:- start:7350 stop:8024 length:675 start_codon:yes stop_codon:yes gene_type:complete